MSLPRFAWTFALLTCATMATLPARAADPEPEVALQRALDQPVTLTLEKVAVSEAFKQIAATAKIPLQVDPACYELLPYGGTTQVSVKFTQSKLRGALQEVLVALGLEETVVGNVVWIRPSGPLEHIGRRADWEELKLMKELWASPDLKIPAAAGAPFSLVEAIRGAMDGRKDLLVQLPVETTGASPLAAAHQKAIEEISKQPMSAYRALEMYCQLTNQIWFVEAGPMFGGATGGTIRIMSRRQWIERQLERPIQLSHKNDPLEAVVDDLSRASGIKFVAEPGLYRIVPMVSLTSDNASVRQTLEIFASATQIAFEVRDDSILLHMAPEPGNQPPRADPTIGHINIPLAGAGAGAPEGLTIDLYLRESDLPPALNELRKKRLQEAVDALQKAMAAPGTQPSPLVSAPPSTQPASTDQKKP